MDTGKLTVDYFVTIQKKKFKRNYTKKKAFFTKKVQGVLETTMLVNYLYIMRY